ncbi:MAG: hypothetical protein V3W18_12750 [candidate division Zixibacteria bacterium]
MRRTALIAALLILVLGVSVYAKEDPGSYADAKAMAAKLDKPLLVNFFTTW